MDKLCICIEKNEDGTFSVYEKDKSDDREIEMRGGNPMGGMPGKPPMPGMGMNEMESEDGEYEEEKENAQPAATLDEALMIASKLLSADERSPEDAVMAGYNKGGVGAAMTRPTPGKVFGDE